MKKLFFIILLSIRALISLAQSTDALNYQAIVRDNQGRILSNQNIGVQFSIRNEKNDILYVETQLGRTDASGLISMQIGEGRTNMSFGKVDWSLPSLTLKTDIDPNGGYHYQISTTSLLRSVPLSLHARTAERLTGPLNELDPLFSNSLAASITQKDTARWNLNAERIEEEDPLFKASLASKLTEIDTAKWNAKLSAESDPTFIAHLASKITEQDITTWNTKLSEEADPTFIAHLASKLTEADTANWNTKLSEEVDPLFKASVASRISAIDTARWNNAMQSFQETDPSFEASLASKLTELDTANWNAKLSEEADPTFVTHLASKISEEDTARWNNALQSFNELDPAFQASLASKITEADTANWNTKLSVELDPTFVAHLSSKITEQDTAAWNAKLSKEVDPTFEAHVASKITEQDTASWNSKLSEEVDPTFKAHIASKITEQDTAAWNAKLSEEVDPTFEAHIASKITEQDTASWNAKLSEEVDPTFEAHLASKITEADTTNWNSKLSEEVDPMFAASIAAQITAADTARWAKDTLVSYTAGTGIVIENNVISLDQNTGVEGSHYLGEYFQGGIIYYLDDDKQHGLIMSINDIDGGSGVRWSNVYDRVEEAESHFEGESNTLAIVNQAGHTASAAQLCLDYSNDGYDDWYLPSIFEMEELGNSIFRIYDRLKAEGNLQYLDKVEYYRYWTSTQYYSDSEMARYYQVTDNRGSESDKWTSSYRVRAIRKF